MLGDPATWLALLSGPTWWLFGQPPYVGLTALGLLVMTEIIVGGLVLAKLRYSPLWVLLLLVPALVVPALWYLAFARWPVEKQADDSAA